MNRKTQELIEQFLSEKRRSNRGGWAEVTDKDIKLLDDIICQLVKSKCEPDADGDYPIQVKLINRRTHERLHFLPVPYSHSRNGSMEEELANCEAALNASMTNMATAAETASRNFKTVQSMNRFVEKMKKVHKLCPDCKKGRRPFQKGDVFVHPKFEGGDNVCPANEIYKSGGV